MLRTFLFPNAISPVVTRLRSPPDTPRVMASPTISKLLDDNVGVVLKHGARCIERSFVFLGCPIRKELGVTLG
ncbi:hypothetical protein PsorP6_016803 [Peronosclerospora sorghi]|uniref:Uncharacterized protein n=1 Tax=Peronosclerospora sorghi TaxID=230839 RepID=A0ACC0WFI9_9STRA|nr:hypothetical protein PsorP6_016803 [Peronosclerospora sorghi]